MWQAKVETWWYSYIRTAKYVSTLHSNGQQGNLLQIINDSLSESSWKQIRKKKYSDKLSTTALVGRNATENKASNFLVLN